MSTPLFACDEKPYISSKQDDNQLRLTLEMMYDVRYNPFEDAEDHNRNKEYKRLMLRANFAYVPFQLTLRDASGKALYHYENYDIKNRYYTGKNGWVAGDYTSWDKAWLCWYDENDRQEMSGLGGFKKNKKIIGIYTKSGLPKKFTYNNSGEIIPFPPTDGWLDLQIGTGILCVDNDGDIESSVYDHCNWMLYKNPKIDIVDKYGNEIENTDVSIKAWINRTAKEELSIDTTVGTTKRGPVLAKGFILDRATHKVLDSYTRGGKSGTLEQLLIGTLYSHHAKRHTTISGTVRQLQRFGVNTDVATNEKFFLMGEVEDLIDSSSQIELCEISYDEYEAIEYEE